MQFAAATTDRCFYYTTQIDVIRSDAAMFLKRVHPTGACGAPGRLPKKVTFPCIRAVSVMTRVGMFACVLRFKDGGIWNMMCTCTCLYPYTGRNYFMARGYP